MNSKKYVVAMVALFGDWDECIASTTTLLSG